MTVTALRLLDGHGYAAALQAGALAVVREADNLDRINVFPVPDADTGTNLTATLRAASARLGLEPPGDLSLAARLAADAALDGARGNSGAIFAQFLHGLAESLRGCGQADTRRFADGAEAGSLAAWQALQDPREGTILSVMRAWSRLALRAARRPVTSTATCWRQRSKRRGRRWPTRRGSWRPWLAATSSTPAGQGFVCWLEGISGWLRTGVVPAEPEERTAPLVAFAAAHAAFNPSYRFCTEALLSHVTADVRRSRRAWPRWASRWWWPAVAPDCASTCTRTPRSGSSTRPRRSARSRPARSTT